MGMRQISGMLCNMDAKWKNVKNNGFSGVRGPNTIQKLLSSVVFLYFACLLPSIALGVLNDDNTHGAISKLFRFPIASRTKSAGQPRSLFSREKSNLRSSIRRIVFRLVRRSTHDYSSDYSPFGNLH